MKLGLLTDIHEHTDNLSKALFVLSEQQVDQVVVLGDLVESGQNLDETCRLLADAKAIGVWGNHDFLLCTSPSRQNQKKFSPLTLQFMATLSARLTIEDCYLSHIEPWLNPECLEDLWYFEGAPKSGRNLKRIFAAVPQRVLMMGHYHKWMLATEQEIIAWQGERPVSIENDRHFVVLGPLCRGHFAVYDTDTSLLAPFSVY